MSRENPIWGAPRIHGELLKPGIDIGETSVSKYMVRQRNPPSPTWRTFLANHLKAMVSVDFFLVPTIRFQILYVFLVLAHDRRRILHLGVTAHPMDRSTTPQCVSLGRSAALSPTGSGWDFRGRLRETGQGYGHRGSASAPRCPWQRAYIGASSARYAASAWII
jgi:hypothetical protein